MQKPGYVEIILRQLKPDEHFQLEGEGSTAAMRKAQQLLEGELDQLPVPPWTALGDRVLTATYQARETDRGLSHHLVFIWETSPGNNICPLPVERYHCVYTWTIGAAAARKG